MADLIKRLNYFTSQFLVDKDFLDEQAYHVDMRRRLNRGLHTWGVVEGLTVTASASKATVAKGMAIDRDGREITLLDNADVDLSGLPDGTIYITIEYQDVRDPNDHYVKDNIDNYLRISELPRTAGKHPGT